VSKVQYGEKCMAMSLQFITVVDKVNSVEGTLR
jgi:hypothetical protein